MVYVMAGIYAVVAIFFLCMAGSYTGKIGHQAQGLWHEDLWQINWERKMMGALPYLAAFFLMIAMPIIFCRDTALEFAFSNFERGDEYIVAAIAWMVWGIAWFVVFLCVVALVGTVCYHWKVADRHARQHEDLQKTRDIVQIAYPRAQWGRWARLKRSKNV
ncbi:hypothetical protein U8Q06_12600 [Rhizobium beringeri]|uniref:hypothetical protein n=1 Tax=Rhizobium beringeri TaxID=3019934 RepID=UPI002E1492AF|nr:hypothetical protein U8Q06_12600 [Rhizobium beringeri]